MRPEVDADIGWVAHLSGVDVDAAGRAIEEASEDRALFRHLAREHESEGRESYVEIDAPFELHALVRLLRPRHVVEVGVSSGVSSAYLLRALERNRGGTLHSVDLPKLAPMDGGSGRPSRMSWSLPRGRTSGWAVPFRLRGRWDLRLGDKKNVLPLLAEELPSVDLMVYDVPHEDRATRTEFRHLEPILTPGAPVIVDHGSSGDLCAALASLGRAHGTRAVRRRGLGLYGVRLPKQSRRIPRRRPRTRPLGSARRETTSRTR